MTTARSRLVPLLGVSLACGVVLGVAIRLVMRWIALESGVDPDSSLGGTLEVVVFGASVGTPIAFFFLLLRPLIPLPKPWAGVVGGGLLFAIAATIPTPAARSALAATPDTPAFTAMAFAVALVGWMMALECVERTISRA